MTTTFDRVREVSTIVGTGAYVLDGPAVGYRAFSSVLVNGAQVYYAVESGSDWEIGIATYNAGPNSLSRTSVLLSSNLDIAVNWGAGEKDIWANAPASLITQITAHEGAADPHPQYLTPAEGDAAYDALGSAAAAQAAAEATAAAALTAHHAPTSADHDDRYYTEAEVDSAVAAAIAAHHAPTSADHDDRYYTEAEVDSFIAGRQPLDGTLTAFAALTIAADSLTVGTGADAFSQVSFAANTFLAKSSVGALVAKPITDFALTILDDADGAAVRATIGAADAGHAHALTDLSDVTITSPSTNEVLSFNGSVWVNAAAPAGAELYDVETTGAFEPSAGGTLSIAIGNTATVHASASQAIAIGNLADANNAAALRAIAFGNAAHVNGLESIAIGDAAVANSTGAIAIGDAASAASLGVAGAISIGDGALTERSGIALGLAARAEGERTVAIGNNAFCSGGSSDDAVALGETSLAQGLRAIAIGANASAVGTAAIAIGPAVSNSTGNTVEIGNTNTNKFRLTATGGLLPIGSAAMFLAPSYTVAGLPTGVTGGIIYVSNEVGGATLAFYNGTNWVRVHDLAVVS